MSKGASISVKPLASRLSGSAAVRALLIRTVLGTSLKVELSWSSECSTAPALAGSVKRITASTNEGASMSADAARLMLMWP